METVASEEPKLIKEDSYVIVQKDDCPRLYQVRKGRMLSVERFQFTLDGAIGYPFGTTFQVANNELVVDEGSDEEEEVINVENGTEKEEKKETEKGEGASKGEGDHEKEEEESMETVTAEDLKEKSASIADGETEKEKTNNTTDTDVDNRNLQDDSSAQKLSAEDITELKDSGATGEEIVSKLVENSATYKDKTEYSKEKYVKKKKRKYVAKFTLLKPTTRLLCESFSGRQSSKFVNLRVDAVSQLLTMTNAKAGSKFMVIEACNGLLCGAVLERLGGTGSLVRLHNEDSHVRLALCAFDFPPHYFDRFCSVSFADLGKRKDMLEKKEELLGQAEADAIAAIQAETALEDEEAQLLADNEEESNEEPHAKKRKTEDEEETHGESGKVEKEEAKGDKVENKGESAKEGDTEKEEKADEQKKDESKEEEKKEEETEEEKEKARKKAAEEKRKKEEDIKRKKAEEKRKKEEAKRRKMDDFRKRKRKAEDETRIKNEEFEELKSTVKALELLEEKMDGLIIASKHHPTNIAMKLIDFLKPSRCFAVFSLYREPLTELYHKLRRRGGIVNMYFTEAWVRRFQIIPDRTHPEMNMDGTGGYILTGTVVEKHENKK